MQNQIMKNWIWRPNYIEKSTTHEISPTNHLNKNSALLWTEILRKWVQSVPIAGAQNPQIYAEGFWNSIYLFKVKVLSDPTAYFKAVIMIHIWIFFFDTMKYQHSYIRVCSSSASLNICWYIFSMGTKVLDNPNSVPFA